MFSRTFVEQLVDVAVLGSGMKRNAMWCVPEYNYIYLEDNTAYGAKY